jgi:hypothetical protein
MELLLECSVLQLQPKKEDVNCPRHDTGGNELTDDGDVYSSKTGCEFVIPETIQGEVCPYPQAQVTVEQV